MIKQQKREVAVRAQHWADLSELLRLHRGLVKSYYQNAGQVMREQFGLKQLHLSDYSGSGKLAVG